MRKVKTFKQGIYKPKNPEKYYHSNSMMNESTKYPVYRSSWELKFFKYCDLTPEIKAWSSEPFAVQYIHPGDNKIHRYFPDFFILYNDRKLLIEIKPQCQATTARSSYDKAQQAINQAKWSAARALCESKGIEFIILTEKELGIGKRKKREARTQKMRSFTSEN